MGLFGNIGNFFKKTVLPVAMGAIGLGPQPAPPPPAPVTYYQPPPAPPAKTPVTGTGGVATASADAPSKAGLFGMPPKTLMLVAGAAVVALLVLKK